ncbi:MAG: hypothetical protein M1835_003515 [Candelina submexicana]|nr:MAG: hypothetical protein M1835_003515 [Candelina submexicana]
MTPKIGQPRGPTQNEVLQPEVIDVEHTDRRKSILTFSQDKERSGTLLAASKLMGESLPSEQAWKAGRKEWMIIIVLAIISLMVALDATILVPVLPMFCELYYIPFYFESVKDHSPTITGLALLPLTCAMLPTSIVIGRLMSKFGRYRWAIWLGWVTAIAGTGLLILLGINTRVYTWVLVFIVVGLGHGLILMSLNFSIQAMADTQNVAHAAAMYTFIRTFGMCIGVAIGGTVLQNELRKHLEQLRLPTGVSNDAERFVTDLKAFPKASKGYQQYLLAYERSFKGEFVVLAALTGLAGILSLHIQEHTMNTELCLEHTLGRRKGPGVPATTSARD